MAVPSIPFSYSDVLSEFTVNSQPANTKFKTVYAKIFGSAPAGSKMSDFAGTGTPSASIQSPFSIYYNSASIRAYLTTRGCPTTYRFWWRETGGLWGFTSWQTSSGTGNKVVNISGLTPDTDYEYYFQYYNGYNDGNIFTTSTVSFSTPSIEPYSITATYEFGQIYITWVDPEAGNPSSYELHQQINGGSWSAFQNPSGTSNSYNFSPPPYSYVRFRIRAKFGTYTSAWVYSNVVNL